MATDRGTVDFILEQIAGAGDVSARAMFGEYGVYCDGRMVAIIADGELFIKPTDAGRSFAPDLEQKPPFPGAKPYLVADPDRWDDGEWMSEIVRVSAAALPLPKPKAGRHGKVI